MLNDSLILPAYTWTQTCLRNPFKQHNYLCRTQFTRKVQKKLQTTTKTREEYKTRFDRPKIGKAEHPAPLKAQEVAAGRWEGLKDKENATEIIRSLEEQGRNIEVQWQSSTIIDKRYEAERSFKPTFADDLFNKDQVKSLRVICAAKIR